MAIDSEGNLIVCQHGDRRIAMVGNTESMNPNFETVVDNYNGKILKRHNDLTIAKDG